MLHSPSYLCTCRLVQRRGQRHCGANSPRRWQTHQRGLPGRRARGTCSSLSVKTCAWDGLTFCRNSLTAYIKEYVWSAHISEAQALPPSNYDMFSLKKKQDMVMIWLRSGCGFNNTCLFTNEIRRQYT